MDDSLNKIKRTSILSVLSLFFQSGYTAVIGLGVNLVLTIVLSPKIFGIYITANSIIALLNYFSDIGLAASLIQRKEINQDDIKSVFTIQQILVIVLVITGYFMTSNIVKFFQLPPEGIYLYWSLLFSFFLSSLKTIPSIFLERKIQFQKIALVQITENTIFSLTVLICALLGLGLKSFTYAVLFRAIVGVVSIYSLSFWIPQIGISIRSLKQLLSFGIPFQTSSFLALFKDDFIMLFLSKALGFEGVGYIGWAKKWAEAPLRIVMDNVTKVLFPLISRIQNDKEKVEKLIEKIMHYQTLLLAPAFIGLALVMSPLVEIIPKYQKWQPALPLFYLFCISAFFSSYSSPFINLFNALGKVKTSLIFMLSWTIATWILTPLLTQSLGIMGFPLTQVILSLTFILVMWQAKKILHFKFHSDLFKILLSSISMGIIVSLLFRILENNFFVLGSIISIAVIMYYLILRVIFKINLVNQIKLLFSYA